MKFSTALTSLILIVPLLAGEALGAAAVGRGQGKFGGFGGKGAGNKGAGKGGAQNGNATATGSAAANSTGSAAANSTGSAATNSTGSAANSTVLAANNGAANNGGAVNSGNAQTSLTLDPAVIAPGFAQNGQQNVTAAGQVPSLTSTNNFINFCLTVNKPLTNGQQIKTGSCNPAPMGVIASTSNMPAAKFVSPVNGQDIAPNTAFTISMAIQNLETGNFVNADQNYYAAPQQVNAQGDIIGHSHFTVSAISSFTDATPANPGTFAFFKGVNSAAVNGVLSEPVAAGLPTGVYRLCSINTDANHMPCLVAVAQHGTLDDCVYFSVGGAGSGGNPFAGGNAAAMQLPAMPLVLVPPAMQLPAMPLPLQMPLPLVLVLLEMPRRLVPVLVPLVLTKVQQMQGMQGKVQVQVREKEVKAQTMVAVKVAVANPALGVTTEVWGRYFATSFS
ncbi:hypothetical protein BGY98DRAFT_8934 [Russula aff. rugulosa BPL654]|nr:hypothetical protein BGY98DRAFT_8934 [Russula aff. rugulosa BPL654]